MPKLLRPTTLHEYTFAMLFTVKVIFNNGGYEMVNSDLLPFKAKIDHYHIHWGRNATSGGAEHTIDGKQYYGELHAVHYNTKYANVGEAMKNADGLAVFGWFIDVGILQIKKIDLYHRSKDHAIYKSQSLCGSNVE